MSESETDQRTLQKSNNKQQPSKKIIAFAWCKRALIPASSEDHYSLVFSRFYGNVFFLNVFLNVSSEIIKIHPYKSR